MTKGLRPFLIAGLLVALALAIFVSPFASSSPDGLNRVAEDNGFSNAATDHAFDSSPLAGYEVEGVEDDTQSKGLSGLIGVVLTFAVASALFAAVRAANARRAASPPGS